MLKKIIIFLFILSFIFIINNNSENIMIPEESIRFRIIANSNSFQDQLQKNTIKDELKNNIIPKIETATNIQNSRNIINQSLKDIEDTLNKYDIKYNIDFGNNYFPSKQYKGITYKEGDYESLVITLGEGIGNNYWCVLYPPLCMIEDTHDTQIEYKSLVKEIITQYKP